MINRKINNIDVMIDERNAALYIDTQNKVDFKYGNIDEILNFFYNKTYSPLSVYFDVFFSSFPKKQVSEKLASIFDCSVLIDNTHKIPSESL